MSLLKYRPRPRTNAIILHDSHTQPGLIHGEHHLKMQGRVMGLLFTGYHFVIDRDGQVVVCREHAVMGSHCPGRNHDTLGVCLLGGLSDDGMPCDNILAQQWVALRTLVLGIRSLYGSHLPVLGHGDVQKLHERTCPCVSPSDIRSLNTR